MPLIPWPDFHDAYPRSFIIFADVEGRAQTRFMLLNRLAQAMQLKGAYALHAEPDLIRVAFERDVDAAKFAAGVQASKTAREGGWAKQWEFIFDTEMEGAIEALLPRGPARKPRPSGSRKMKRRALPL